MGQNISNILNDTTTYRNSKFQLLNSKIINSSYTINIPKTDGYLKSVFGIKSKSKPFESRWPDTKKFIDEFNKSLNLWLCPKRV